MRQDPFPAHIRNDGTEQSVSEHCRGAASIAGADLKGVSLNNTGYLAGLLHDLGKYTDEFREYITRASRGEKVVRGSVNHTFSGTRFILEQYRDRAEVLDVLTKDVIAYAVGGHHEPFDCVNRDGSNGFEYRCEKEGIHYSEAVQSFETYCATEEELNFLYEKSQEEISEKIEKIKTILNTEKSVQQQMGELAYYCGILARLVQSAVADGDRLDTAAFMEGRPLRAEGQSTDLSVWERELRYAEEKINALECTSDVNRARKEISDRCRQAAEQQPGIFQLCVPTGSGKTLSALRFALAHAARWGKRRLIFTSPLLSILEQNASVIRGCISDQSLILEHHSNAVEPEDIGDELNPAELYQDNWEARIIITTMVQFLDTCFGEKMSNIRRFHSLCDAVIVIDEIQSLPSNLLTMFSLMMTFLSRICGATLVFCTATQPNWKKLNHPLMQMPRDIVPYEENLWKVFKRTTIIDGGTCTLDEMPSWIEKLMEDTDSMLVICNKKNESEYLYEQCRDRYECFHLSASMCMAHRKKVLDQLREALQNRGGKQILCIATQVIEAGVDISFGRVVRALAGLDNVAQAAGRCNRNGEYHTVRKVYTLCLTDENLEKLEEIRMEKAAAWETMRSYAENPQRYHSDLTSREAIADYYETYYREMSDGYQDDAVAGQMYTVYSLMSDNMTFVARSRSSRMHLLNQSFKLAGEYFKVFDDDTIQAVVPYEEGKEVIAGLECEQAEYDPEFRKSLMKQARAYTVTLYPYQLAKLRKEQAVIEVTRAGLHSWYLLDGYYDADTGVTMTPKPGTFLGV